MLEYGWRRMFRNIPGFLICLNKTKYGSISLEYARIYLKYDVKDAIKLLYKLDNIYKERSIQNSIKHPRWNFCENVWYGIMNIPCSLNMLCDRNMPGFWIWQGYTRFWICVSLLLNNVNNAWTCLNMPETEPEITVRAK